MPFDAFTLEDGKSLGGSESAALGLGEALARLGHNVAMFVNVEPGQYPRSREGSTLQFLPLNEWESFAQNYPHNICVVQRLPLAFAKRTAADMNILWCHDLPIIEQRNDVHGALWNIDKMAMVSDFHRAEYERVYDLKPDVKNADDPFVVLRNSVDVPDLPDVVRDPNHLIYTSRPERGLDVLLSEIMPRVLKERPEARLSICTYDNPTDRTSAFLERCKYLASLLGDRVSFIGPQSKDNLYKLMKSAGCLVYPCPSPEMPDFAEVSCITFMEAMHCGLPVVTTKWGASPETLAGYDGALLSDVGVWDTLAANVCAQLSRVEGGNSFSGGSLRNWDLAAGEWMAAIEERYAERNSDPVRLFHHWYRRSEIDGCRKLVDAGKVGDREAALLEPFEFSLTDEGMAKHYGRCGEETLQSLKATKAKYSKEFLGWKKDEPRFHQLLRCLAGEHARRVEETGDKDYRLKVLDYGCGHGWFAAFAGQHLPFMDYVGVDFDPGAIEWAREMAEVAETTGNCRFEVVNDFVPDAEYDVGILSEVLEHVDIPQVTASTVEAMLRKDGLMLITVPFGPVEYGTYNWTNFRNHIREFTRQDLSDIFSGKPDVAFEVMPQGQNEETGDTWGHYLVAYRADHMALGEIDWERKFKWTMPRETLSACLIAGPDVEKTLGWCLDSLKWICDEIVIGDNGMSEGAKQIALGYGARLVPAPNPLREGFAKSRNAALEECTGDWVIWIDTDEKLTSPRQLVKYLRKSIYRGWSVQQHHFSIDVMGQVDKPVRVFRRDTDPKTQFYGVVHEHPEMIYNEGPGRVGQPPDLHIMHVGYEDEPTRMKRFARNLPLLQRDIQENPDRSLQVQLICRDSMLMAREILRGSNGADIPAEAQHYAQQTIDTFRARYLGKEWKLAAVSPLPYYSQAAQLLGGTIKARVNIEVNRRGQGAALPDPGEDPSVLCFASMEDLEGFIDKEVKAAVRDLKGTAWDALSPPQ